MNTKTILIAEDESIIRRLFKRLLSGLGCDLIFVEGVKEGKEKIESLDVDLLLSDLKFPDGSGIDLIRKFREKFPKKQAIIITGSLSPEDRLQQAADCGVTECIGKPFEMNELISVVKNALGQSFP